MPATPGCTTRSPGEKDLVRLPGLVAVAYQHETSRCGDPHLHTHVIVPNRQARADGALVSIDGTSLYHEAKAAGVIYQATLRRELHRSLGFEWAPVDPSHRDGRTRRRRPRQRSPRGRGARPSCASGRPDNLDVGRRAVDARRSSRPRRRPPARPNPKSSPGRHCWSSGAPMRAACAWTAHAFDAARAARARGRAHPVRPGAPGRRGRADRQGRVHPRRPGRDHRRATARRHRARHRASWWRPRSTRSACG